MPKVSPIQNSFTAGEFAPTMYGRSDLDRYKTGLKTCVNYLPTVQGPITRRPGTKFVHPTRHPGGYIYNVALFPFKYSRSESYVIEHGISEDLNAKYFRFFKDNALLTEPQKSIAGATNANPVVVTVTGHGYANNSRVVVSSVNGMSQLNNREFVAASLTANTLGLYVPDNSASVDGTSFDAYVSSGFIGKVYEITASIDTHYGSLFNDPIVYQVAQSADVLYFAGARRSPFKLSRYGDLSWTYTPLQYDDGPYLPVNDTGTTLAPSGPTGTIAIVASSVNGINNNQGFHPADVGRPVRILQGTVWGHATITAFGSVLSVTAIVATNFASASATPDWRLGAYQVDAYPTGVTFHEDRLWLMGGVNSQLLAGSRSGAYESFSPSDTSGSTAADDGLTLLLAAAEANNGQWLSSDEKGLIVGTAGGPWVVRPNDQGSAITAINANARRVSSYGSAAVPPVQADKATLYLQNSTKKLREFMYFYDIDGFRSTDLTLLSEHVTGAGVDQLVFQKEPQPRTWLSRTDGTLTSMVYDRDTDNLKAGWTPHVLGGFSDASHTVPAATKKLTMIPNSDGTRDELWMINERYIGGRTKLYVEYLMPTFGQDTAPEDAFHFDSGLTYDSTTRVSTVTGLNHLEGETVSILKDGAVHPDRTVTLGKIVLESSASTVHVGYKYASKAQLLRTDAGSADGTALGKTRRIHRVGMLLHRTGGLKIGMDFSSTLQEVNFRSASHSMGQAVPLYSGIISETLDADYDYENEFCWQQDTGLPGTILAVMPQMVTQD